MHITCVFILMRSFSRRLLHSNYELCLLPADWVESPFAKSLHSQGLRPRQTFVPPGPMPTAEEDEDDEASEQQGGTACVKPNEGVSSSTPPQAEDIEVGSHHIFSKSLKRRRIYIRACYVAIFNLIWAHYSGEDLFQTHTQDFLQLCCMSCSPLFLTKAFTMVAILVISRSSCFACCTLWDRGWFYLPADLSKVSKWEWVLTGLPGLGKTVWIIFAIASSLQKQSIISVFVQLKKGKTWEISRWAFCSLRARVTSIALFPGLNVSEIYLSCIKSQLKLAFLQLSHLTAAQQTMSARFERLFQHCGTAYCQEYAWRYT